MTSSMTTTRTTEWVEQQPPQFRTPTTSGGRTRVDRHGLADWTPTPVKLSKADLLAQQEVDEYVNAYVSTPEKDSYSIVRVPNILLVPNRKVPTAVIAACQDGRPYSRGMQDVMKDMIATFVDHECSEHDGCRTQHWLTSILSSFGEFLVS